MEARTAPGEPTGTPAEQPAGAPEYLVTGAGRPATAFVPGLTGSIAQTRPFGSGVAGTRVFLHLRGHGDTPVPVGPDGQPDPGDFDDLAAELRSVLAATGATRALGISLGAEAVVRLLVRDPCALRRAVLVLPPAPVAELATADGRTAALLAELADAVDGRELERVGRLLREHQPAAVRRLPAVAVWARRRASELAGTPVSAVLRRFGAERFSAGGPGPVATADQLARIRIPVLVIGQHGDDAHPVPAAQWYAAALPAARLELLPAGAIPWRGRAELRALISGFLNDADAGAGAEHAGVEPAGAGAGQAEAGADPEEALVTEPGGRSA